jgi:hypothetical protein
MDAGNLAFGALVVGQWLADRPFSWRVAGGGVVLWAGLFGIALALLYFERGES